MAVDFPGSPTSGQVFSVGGASWRYNGYAWARIPDPGAKGEPGQKGEQGIQGIQGIKGIQGNFGGATFDYTFSDATGTPTDLNTGRLRLNNSSVSSATIMFIDDEDDNGTDIQPFLRTIDDSTSTIKGHVRISNKLNADDFALFTISSTTEQSGFHQISVGYVSGSATSFTNGEDIIVTFARTGDQGQKGDQGIQGIPGVQDKIFEGNTEAEVVDTGTNGHFKVTTEGGERFRITDDKAEFSVDAKVDSNNQRDLGTSSNRWKSLFLGTQLEIDAASSTDMIMLDAAGTNFARIGHNTDSGTDILDIRSEGHTRFLTNGNNERVRIESGGTLKSTISSPDPFNTVNTNLNLVNGAGNQGAGSRIEFSTGAAKAHIQSQVTGSNSNSGLALVFATSPDNAGADERLRITSDGKLEVQGTRAGALQANDDDALKLFTKSTSDDINRGTGITFYTHDGSGYEMGGTIQVAKENGTVDDPKSYMRFSTQDGSTTAERLRITSDGKIGINQTTPSVELEVQPPGTATSSTIFIHAPTHNATAKSELTLKFGYGHSGNPDAVGHIKMIEDANNSFSADFIFGLPSNNGSGGSGTNERFRIKSNAAIGLNGANYGTSGQVLTSQGENSAVIWDDLPASITYSIRASQADNGTNPGSGSTPNNDPFLFLDGTSGTDSHIQIKGSGSAKVTRNADDEITISSTTYTLGTADGDTGTEEKITLSVSGGGDTTADNVILVAGTGLSIARDTTSGKITFTNTDTGSGSNNTFIGLSDVTPANYTGHAHKLVRVNKDGTSSNGTGLEFIEEKDYTLPAGGTDSTDFGNGNATITLTETQGSSVTTDPITITAGTNVKITGTSATGFTISAKDTNTQIPDTTYDLLVVQTGGNNANPAIKLDASSGDDDEVQLAAVDHSGITVTRGDDETINFNTSLQLIARQSSSGSDANPNLDLMGSATVALDTVKFVGGDNVNISRNSNGNEITISSSGTLDVTQLNLNRIRFGPGNAVNDDANIEWLGGSNDGYLRISTSDDSGAEYIELGDYDNTDIGGTFTQWMKLNRTELYMARDVRLNAALEDKDGQKGTSGQVLTSTGSQINWVDSSSVGENTDTKYDLLVPSGTTKIRLEGATDSGNTNDDVEIAAGTNITVTRNNANKLTIASSATLSGTIDEANKVKVNTSTENEYHNITFVPKDTTSGSHQTLEIDSTDQRLAWNPSNNRLQSYDTQTYRLITWSGGSSGTAGQVLTSGGTGGWSWTSPSSLSGVTYQADGNYGMQLDTTQTPHAFQLENDRRRNSNSADIYTGNTHDYTFYDASHGIRWYTSGNEEMRLENDGDLHVDGDIIAYSTTISDIRLKKDLQIIQSPLDILSNINGYTFTYKKDDKKSAGVVAQEVEKVFPQAVSEKGLPFSSDDEENPDKYKTVEYDQIVGLLVQAVKELTDKVKKLEGKS